MNHKFITMFTLVAATFSTTLFAQNLPADFDKTPLNYDESVVRAPIKDQNEMALTTSACRGRDHGLWSVCYNYNPEDRSQEQVMSFSIANLGGNPTVPGSGFSVSRRFSVQFRDFATSDLNILMIDTPSENESQAHYAMYMFFPRVVVPAIRHEKDFIELTLPTNEKVYFDSKTKQIISGVLKELPMRLDAKGNALRPQLIYSGKGYMLEASRLHDYPVGDTYNAQTGVSAIATNKALLKNAQGQKCSLNVKDLWETNYNKGGAVFFNYATDAAFQKYTSKKCRF